MRVLKYEVPIDDRWYDIEHGKIALVEQQVDSFVANVWVVVDEETLEYERSINDMFPHRVARVYGTGQPCPDEKYHIGSYQSGFYVWHVFAIVMNEMEVVTDAKKANDENI